MKNEKLLNMFVFRVLEILIPVIILVLGLVFVNYITNDEYLLLIFRSIVFLLCILIYFSISFYRIEKRNQEIYGEYLSLIKSIEDMESINLDLSRKIIRIADRKGNSYQG